MSEGEGETLHQSHLVIAPVCRCTAEVLKPSSIVCVFGVCSGWISIKTMSRGGQHRSSGERRICRDSETRGAAGGMGHDRKTVGNHFVWANDWLCFLFLTCIKSCLACALGYGCLMLFESLVCCSLVTFFFGKLSFERKFNTTALGLRLWYRMLCSWERTSLKICFSSGSYDQGCFCAPNMYIHSSCPTWTIAATWHIQYFLRIGNIPKPEPPTRLSCQVPASDAQAEPTAPVTGGGSEPTPLQLQPAAEASAQTPTAQDPAPMAPVVAPLATPSPAVPAQVGPIATETALPMGLPDATEPLKPLNLLGQFNSAPLDKPALSLAPLAPLPTIAEPEVHGEKEQMLGCSGMGSWLDPEDCFVYSGIRGPRYSDALQYPSIWPLSNININIL